MQINFDAPLPVQNKALLLGSIFLVDFMFFEVRSCVDLTMIHLNRGVETRGQQPVEVKLIMRPDLDAEPHFGV